MNNISVTRWFDLTGEHRLAFGVSRSVQVQRKKAKPQHPQRWRGGDLYNYGDLPPRYPMPATMDNAVMALFNQPKLITQWSVAWFKRDLHKTS